MTVFAVCNSLLRFYHPYISADTPAGFLQHKALLFHSVKATYGFEERVFRQPSPDAPKGMFHETVLHRVVCRVNFIIVEVILLQLVFLLYFPVSLLHGRCPEHETD